MSYTDAASLTGVAITGIQSFKRAVEFLPPSDSLEGKTVFIPAALSGTGSIGCQLAKNVYHAGKVITTVSTSKIPLVEQYLGPGLVDQIIDYTKQDVLKEIPDGSIDFFYNTQWQMTSHIPVVNPETGIIISIASIPAKRTMQRVLGSAMPFWLGWILDLAQLWYSWKLWGTKVQYEFVSGNPSDRTDLDTLEELVKEGKIKAVVGKVVDLDDINGVRQGCNEVFTGKGGVGKLVIQIA
jgi:NADPH:quinone reductase-like Zn-dependent oxidoreductase